MAWQLGARVALAEDQGSVLNTYMVAQNCLELQFQDIQDPVLAFKCTKNKKCIPVNLRCNGQDDCGDEEDEKDCRKSLRCLA